MGHVGAIWADLGAVLGALGAILGDLEAILGLSGGVLGALGAILDAIDDDKMFKSEKVALQEPLGAVLGRSWGILEAILGSKYALPYTRASVW